MVQWHVKKLSTLTKVSVQTLHYYDRIQLLKPSLRAHNGYRLYGPKDLQKLQQIIALKFFGFSLKQIKHLLTVPHNFFQDFQQQAEILEKKSQALLKASLTLKKLVSESLTKGSCSWETLIKMIEVYTMAQNLDNAWVSEVLSVEELQQYATFEADLKTKSTPEAKEAFDLKWTDLVKDMKQLMDKDPRSPSGVKLAEQVLDLINGLYGEKHANLKHVLWKEGFKKGKHGNNHIFTPAMVEWLDAAMDQYIRDRIYTLLEKIDRNPTSALEEAWSALLKEMYGTSREPKEALVHAAIKDPKVGLKAKKWLERTL